MRAFYAVSSVTQPQPIDHTAASRTISAPPLAPTSSIAMLGTPSLGSPPCIGRRTGPHKTRRLQFWRPQLGLRVAALPQKEPLR